jgi:hypothetical protein
MHIVLLILKIIGMILLVLLGLLLLGAVVIILNPICYRLEGSYGEKLQASFSVRWLFRLIVLRGKYDSEEGLDLSGRIAWIPLKRREHEKNVSEKGKKKAGKNKKKGTKSKKETGDVRREAVDSRIEAADGQKEVAEVQKDDSDSRKENTDSRREAEDRVKRFRFIKRLQQKINQIKYTFHLICDKLKSLREKKDEAAVFLKKEEHQMAIRHIFRQIWQVLRKLMPKKWYIRGVVGFDDPATTGEFFGGLAIIYAWLGNGIQVLPDFEESRIELELFAKGKMRILTLICMIIRLAIDRQSREFIIKVKNMFS